MEKATFGVGCFWGTETAFQRTVGVASVSVGYSGGETNLPTYKDVYSGKTGHAEVVEVTYDPSIISYAQLLDVFWNIHDPTTLNKQGPDIGTQYRSVIFFRTPEQQETATHSLTKQSQNGRYRNPIVTEITPYKHFYRAEEYHHHYFQQQDSKLFSLLLFLAPVLAFFAPKGMTPLAVTTLLYLLLFTRHRKSWFLPIPFYAVATVIIFVIWAGFSTLWSLDWSVALLGVAKLFLVHGFGIWLLLTITQLSDDETDRTMRALFCGFLLAACLIAIELIFRGPIYEVLRGIVYHPRGSGLFWLNPAAGIQLIMVWPILFWLNTKNQQKIAFATLIGLFGLVYWLDYRSGLVALALGTCATMLIYFFRSFMRPTISLLFILGVLSAPIILGSVKPSDVIETESALPKAALHRLLIWNFAAEKILEKPLQGWGMNAARLIPGGQDKLIDASKSYYGQKLPLHPHNIAIQVWLELGLTGAILLCVFGALVILAITTQTLPLSVASCSIGQFTTALVILSLSYGVWQTWWEISLYLAAAVMIAVSRLSKLTQRIT